MSRQLVDLSFPIRDGEVTYPSLPVPVIDEFLTREASREHYAEGTEFSIGRISMIGNTGTYLDSPFHRFSDGVDLAGLSLEQTVDLPGIVIRVTEIGRREIDAAMFEGHDVGGRAVLINTGWDVRSPEEQLGADKPFVTRDGALWLAEHGAALVGIDILNIDDYSDPARPAHTEVLRAGIPLVEHLRGLDQLPDNGFRFSAAVAAVHEMGTWPVRAYAVVESASET